MAQGIEFNIDAKDQASKVLNTVNKKIQDFGKEVGKSIISVVGPMALIGTAVSKVTDYLDEMKRKAEEAFNWGAGLKDSADKLGVTVEEFQKISAAADETGESVEKVAKAFKLASDLILSAKAGNKDAAAALEAMGLSTEKLADMKPQDVLKAIAAAMAATPDPANRAAIAIGALGKSAKELQDVLAKGFDIAGALESTEGLTNEEAAFLRQQKRDEQRKQNREKLKAARKQAAMAFLESDEGKAILEREQEAFRMEKARAAGAGAGGMGMSLTAADIASRPAIQSEIQSILASREAARTAAVSASANPAAAEALRVRAENDDKKEKEAKEKEAKEPKGAKVGGVSNDAIGGVSIKTPALTVSSLREIGGAIAGESMAGLPVDLLQVQVDIQKSMLKELETLNNRSGDFTKPDPRLGLGAGVVVV